MLTKLREYFNLTYTRAIALIIVFSFIVLLSVLYFSLPYFYKPQIINQQQLKELEVLASNTQLDTSINRTSNFNYKKFDTTENLNADLFVFDPNTATIEIFLKLGISEKVAHTIVNYRNKGGNFYNKEAFKKVWGLSEKNYNRLSPYISIAQNKQYENKVYKPREKVIVEINTADTILLNKLPMIGNTMSQRIVEYRKALGGFYSLSQLKEVYGITDETFNLIRHQLVVNVSKVKKININEVLFQDLKEHPYFRNGLALSILKYRKQKEKIQNVEEIKANVSITEEDYNKIKNYIIF